MSTSDSNKQESESKTENSTKKLGDSNYEDSLKIAEKFKEEGNNALKENKFQEAYDKYTLTINLKKKLKKIQFIIQIILS